MRLNLILITLLVYIFAANALSQTELPKLFAIEGRISFRSGVIPAPAWQAQTTIYVDYQKHLGFVREDGSFTVDGLLPGSYIVEVRNIDYVFEPSRVDITSKGKIRARRLNLLQPNAVVVVPYPLDLQPRQPARYFRAREEWRMTDVLMNPMVIMLLVAFLLMVLAPKLGSQDPEQLQKELQSVQMPKMELPELADMMANFFGGGSKSKKTKKPASGPSSGPSGHKRIAR